MREGQREREMKERKRDREKTIIRGPNYFQRVISLHENPASESRVAVSIGQQLVIGH